MPIPTRILLRPASVTSLLRPAFIVRLLRFRWRIIAAVVAMTVGVALWAAFTPYSARTIIYVEGLGPEGILTNVDRSGLTITEGF